MSGLILFVNPLAGEQVSLELPLDAKVIDAMREVPLQMGEALSYQGAELIDWDMPLADVGVCPEATLCVVLTDVYLGVHYGLGAFDEDDDLDEFIEVVELAPAYPWREARWKFMTSTMVSEYYLVKNFDFDQTLSYEDHEYDTPVKDIELKVPTPEAAPLRFEDAKRYLRSVGVARIRSRKYAFEGREVF